MKTLQQYKEHFNIPHKELQKIKNPPMLAGILKNAVSTFGLDDYFTRNDSDYYGCAGTYKGNPCSMAQYVLIKYGQSAHDFMMGK